jgi:voltage-gated potassium channel
MKIIKKLRRIIYSNTANMLLAFIIILSVTNLIINLSGNLTASQKAYQRLFNLVFTFMFVLELLIKFIVDLNKKTFILRFWIDILAVLPFLRLFRILRIFRLFKFISVLKGIDHQRIKIFGKSITSATYETMKIVIFIFVIIFSLSILIHHVEGESNKYFSSFSNCIWWVVTTLSTVGYGDIVPKTPSGKLITIIVMLTAIAVFGSITGLFANFIFNKLRGHRKMDINYKNSIFILGWNSCVPKIVDEIIKKDETASIVIAGIFNEEPGLLNAFIINTDYTLEENLEKINIKKAKNIIIISDTTESANKQEMDARIILTAFTVTNICDNDAVNIIAEINNQRHEKHLKKIGVDEVVVTNDYSGNLLANAALVPGTYQIFKELLTSNMENEFYKISSGAKVIGENFSGVSSYLKDKFDALLVGIERNGRIMLNPRFDEVIVDNDSLFIISREYVNIK